MPLDLLLVVTMEELVAVVTRRLFATEIFISPDDEESESALSLDA